MVDKLKGTFLPHNDETVFWNEIRNRTQHPNEKVVVFAAVLENMFGRLPHVSSEATRLSVIRKNSKNSVAELVRCCRAVEDAKLSAAQFHPPPLVNSSLVELQC